ncbi:MAG: hypothetical protein HDT46_10015 [Ruminococcaceae bacterium]|nr:hypothetical protein [Oscillospiraceae bacterium]
MDKKEILAKARAEKSDERETFILDKSMHWTFLVMTLSAGIFTIVRSCQDLPIMDLCATVCLSVGTGFMYRFIKNRQKFNLITGILMIFFGIVSAVEFFIGK